MKKTTKMIEEWKENYKIEAIINLTDIENRIKKHKEKGYRLEAFFLLLAIIENDLRTLIMTRNLRLSILLELDNNPTFGYYINFDDKNLTLGKLKNAFEKFFKEETGIIGLLNKFKKKRNDVSHFLIDKSEDGKKLLSYAISEEKLKEAENLKEKLYKLTEEEYEKMNELQEKIDKKEIA